MKYRILIYLCAIVMIQLSAAGCKKQPEQCEVSCPNEMVRFIAMGFQPGELDTVIIDEYYRSDTALLSTRILYQVGSPTTNGGIYIDMVRTNFQYRVSIPATGDEYFIKGFEFKGPRTMLFDCDDTRSCYNELDYYYINGQKSTGHALLYKQ